MNQLLDSKNLLGNYNVTILMPLPFLQTNTCHLDHNVFLNTYLFMYKFWHLVLHFLHLNVLWFWCSHGVIKANHFKEYRCVDILTKYLSNAYILFVISDNWYNNIGGCDRRANSRGDNRWNRCLCRYTPKNSSG